MSVQNHSFISVAKKSWLIGLVILFTTIVFSGCGGGGNSSSSSSSGGSSTKTSSSGPAIRGVVNDDPVSGATVYVDFGDGNKSATATTNADGSFEIDLSKSDINEITPDVPEGYDAPIDDLLIVAEKNGKVLRNAIPRDTNLSNVFITNDTEAYAEYLESIGAFSTNTLTNFNDQLQNGRIKDDSPYATFVKDTREDVKTYFMNGGDKPTKKQIFTKAFNDMNKSTITALADSRSLLSMRDIVSGGEIMLPSDVKNITSDDGVAITPKGNGRYVIGDGNNADKTIYIKVEKADGTFALLPVNIKSKTVTQVASQTVNPKQRAVLGDASSDVQVTIPPFAINEQKNIVVNKVVTDGESVITTNSGAMAGKKIVDLQPSGLKFQVPITVKINYGQFGITDPDSIQWMYGDKDEGYDPATVVNVDKANKVVYLSVDHFSGILAIKSLNGQKFLDLGANFVTVIPARNFAAKLNGDIHSSDGIYNLHNKNVGALIITNKLFEGDSFNHKRTHEGQPGGGHCVQTAYILQDLFKKSINTGDANDNISKWKQLKKDQWSNNGWVTDLSQASTGDVVYSKIGKYGHTQVLIKIKNKYYLTDSNGLLKSKLLYDKQKRYYYKNIGEGEYSLRTRVGYKQITTKDLMTQIQDKYQFNSKLKKTGYFTRDEIIDLINKYREDHSNWINAVTNNGKALIERTDIDLDNSSYDDIITTLRPKKGKYLVKHLEASNIERYPQYKTINQNNDIYKPVYFYYFINETNIDNNHPNGVLKDNSNYKYYPDLLPVAPLRVHFDNSGRGTIQNYEDGRYEIYAEHKESATFQTNDGKRLNYSDTNITLPNAFGNVQLTRLKLARDENKTSLTMVGNNLDRSLTVSGINNPIKILFSPIAIDDYYVNWGINNVKNNQPKPIGFWNSYGADIDDNNGTGYDVVNPLQPGKVYKSENAVNGYFMTLGQGKSAQWHFTLAGQHTIFVNVPTGNVNDIKDANYTLSLNGSKIPLKVVSSGDVNATFGQKINGSAFSNWFILKSKNDDNVTFNLTGNDYLEVNNNTNNPVVVDAIRLEGRQNRLEALTLAGKASLSNETDESSLKCILKVCNILKEQCIEVPVSFGQGFNLKIPANLNHQVKLNIKYIPVNNMYDNIHPVIVASLRTVNDIPTDLVTKYKPAIQDITINPGERVKNIPAVVLQPYGTKDSVKIHLIDATQQNTPIKDANVTIRYGLDNENNQSVAYSGKTDVNGDFTVNNMPYGQYTATLTKSGYVSTHLNMKVDENSNATNDLSMSPVLPASELRIVLTWGQTPFDLDSHLVKIKNGEKKYQVYYGDMNPTSEANLDRDDTDSYGPEAVTIHSLDANATYKYYIHDYSTYSGNTGTALENSGATVKVYWGSHIYTYNVPSHAGTAWKVFEIDHGNLVPCTGDQCMFGVNGDTDSQFGTRSLSGTDFDKILFENLPQK